MLEMTVGEVVAQNIKSAEVFYKHKIDFCCKGNIKVADVAAKKNIDANLLISELESILKEKVSDDFKSYSNYDLIEDIVNKHHKYVTESIELLTPLVNKVARVHGAEHPELLTIKEMFFESAEELKSHMAREEGVLFPFINVLTLAVKDNVAIEKPHFATVNNPIARMMEEHSNEGERFETIQELSNDFNPPESACNTYRFVYSKLQEFQKDLHEHIHKENNILFPRAAELEKKVTFLN